MQHDIYQDVPYNFAVSRLNRNNYSQVHIIVLTRRGMVQTAKVNNQYNREFKDATCKKNIYKCMYVWCFLDKTHEDVPSIEVIINNLLAHFI